MSDAIQDAWRNRCEVYAKWGKRRVEVRNLYAEYNALRAEGYKLYAEWDKLRAEGYMLYAEGNKIRAEGNVVFISAVIAAFGKNALIEFDEPEKGYCTINKTMVLAPTGDIT